MDVVYRGTRGYEYPERFRRRRGELSRVRAARYPRTTRTRGVTGTLGGVLAYYRRSTLERQGQGSRGPLNLSQQAQTSDEVTWGGRGGSDRPLSRKTYESPWFGRSSRELDHPESPTTGLQPKRLFNTGPKTGCGPTPTKHYG
jgi:hypothetical protein